MMENMEKWTRVQIELPESFLEKIKAICELREIDTGTWIREAIAYNLAHDVSNLTGGDWELLLEHYEDVIKKSSLKEEAQNDGNSRSTQGGQNESSLCTTLRLWRP